MKNFLLKFLLIFVLSTNTSSLFAHEMWLEPLNFAPATNDTFQAHIKVGQKFNGEAFPYIYEETKSTTLFLQKKEIKLKHRDGDFPAIQSVIPKRGLYVLTYQSNPEQVKYSSFEQFKFFLKEENIWENWSKENPSFINTKIKEIYTRYAKSLVQVGDSYEKDFYTGMPMEWIALENPYLPSNNKGISVLLQYNNQPFANSPVTIFRKKNNNTYINKIITDQNGKAFIKFDEGGKFLINAVHLIKNNQADADWHSLWASLTFEKK